MALKLTQEIAVGVAQATSEGTNLDNTPRVTVQFGDIKVAISAEEARYLANMLHSAAGAVDYREELAAEYNASRDAEEAEDHDACCGDAGCATDEREESIKAYREFVDQLRAGTAV